MEYNTSEILQWAQSLRAGDSIYLSGTVYTARDAAHAKIADMLDRGLEAPFPLPDAVIYYAGPTPARPGEVCGSFGPTTAGRMDAWAGRLYREGVAATIGKGERSDAVRAAIRETGSLYLVALGGAGALAAKHIISLQEIAFPELGCESVKKLTFDRFPLFVGTDCTGRSVYERK